MMEEQWYLARDEEQTGPHTRGELRHLLEGVDFDDQRVLVWTEQMTEWLDPREVPGLLPSGAPGLEAVSAGVGEAGEEEKGGVEEPTLQLAASGEGGVEAEDADLAVREQSESEPEVSKGPDLAYLNPYETPGTVRQAVANAAAPAGPVECGNHPLAVEGSLRTGWKLTTSNFGKLVAFGLIYTAVVLLASVPLAILDAKYGAQPQAQSVVTASQMGVSFFTQAAQTLISLFFGIGGALFALGIVRQSNPKIGLLFVGGTRFLSVVLAWLLYTVIVIGGAILLLIPGIYLGVRLGQWQVAIVDRELGPLDGLKASWEMTRGNFWRLFLLWFLSGWIIFFGMIALGVGLLWAVPTVLLAYVVAYICMSEGRERLPQFA
jgi:hypothetical protein